MAVAASIRAENEDRIEGFVGAALECFVPGTEDRTLASTFDDSLAAIACQSGGSAVDSC